MRNYITSDWHLLHKNIIKYAERLNYKSTNLDCEKMSQDIIESIDKQVPDEKDVVLWNLGDLFFGRMFSEKTFDQLYQMIKVLKGKNRKLNLVLGNHDRTFKKYADWSKLKPLKETDSLKQCFEALGFDNVYDRPVVFFDQNDTTFGKYVILSHEPLFIPKDEKIINIHGHVHQRNLKSDFFTLDFETVYNPDGSKSSIFRRKVDWEKFIVNPKNYYNICWDNPEHLYKVWNLDALVRKIFEVSSQNRG